MKQKELTISIPEGYEIDKEKSTFEKIVFKPVDSKIRSWSDYVKTSIKGKWTFLCGGKTLPYTSSASIETVCPSVIFDSKEEAEAIQALIKLRLLRNQWVGDWKPKDDEDRYVVMSTPYHGVTVGRIRFTASLDFPTKEMAEDFIKTFHPLLEQAKLLI